METSRKIRIIISKVGLDGHDRGAKVVAALLREAGMEVVYLGMYQIPEGIVQAAIDEDVDVIGLSIHSGAHMVWTQKVIERLKEKKAGDIAIIVGGIIPIEDANELKRMGVAEVFGPGSSTREIAKFLRENVGARQH